MDGITWNYTKDVPHPSNSTVSGSWDKIIYGNDKFIVISRGNVDYLAYSYDGINWNYVSDAFPYSAGWIENIAYGDGKFVVTSSNSQYMTYSDDGINWKLTSQITTLDAYNCIAYGDGKFVSLGAPSARTNTAIYSVDGITWETTYLPVEAIWVDITYGNGKFVALARHDGIAAYSTDGITWKEISVPNKRWHTMVYGNDRFIACTNDNASDLMFSYDGIIWKTGDGGLYQNDTDMTNIVRDTLNVISTPFPSQVG